MSARYRRHEAPCTACPDRAARHVPNDMVCYATRRGFELVALNQRPFPLGNSLPKWVPLYRAATRCPYEGEPREEMPMLIVPEPQLWGPRWLDTIVALWAGPISLDGDARRVQRDRVIELVSTFWTSSMKRALWESAARDGDLRAARDLLRPVIVGDPPETIAEFEARR